ncbi:DUF996 domain-containing protein [Thermococcus sp.]|uniref:DUF996 domain-containing protein n=1 Tax=Thermococcus sp. TaxID=35749 RepID=UPI00260528C9|nr:DUF996 domain-containing protein [Thermococcus sp.]
MAVNVRSEKNLGLWGSILSLLGVFVPYIGNVLSLVGLILVLVALHGIGKAVGDDRPFRYYLYAVLSWIAAIIVLVLVVLAMFLSTGPVLHWGISADGAIPGEPWIGPMGHEMEPHPWIGLGAVVLIILVLIIAVVVSVYFEIKTWRAMYEITGTKEFDEAATWFKWGAITLIFVVGLLLLLIAKIFVILGFSNMPEELGVEPAPESPMF